MAASRSRCESGDLGPGRRTGICQLRRRGAAVPIGAGRRQRLGGARRAGKPAIRVGVLGQPVSALPSGIGECGRVAKTVSGSSLRRCFAFTARRKPARSGAGETTRYRRAGTGTVGPAGLAGEPGKSCRCLTFCRCLRSLRTAMRAGLGRTLNRSDDSVTLSLPGPQRLIGATPLAECYVITY